MNSFTLERNNYRRKLITLVKQHTILWNKKQEQYNKKLPLKNQAWFEISQELNISVDKLRRTWENLRDQYRRDLKREQKYGFKSKWRFFNDMDFIRPMVACKESQNEFTDSDEELDVNDSQQSINQTQCSVITTNLTTPTTPTISTQQQQYPNSQNLSTFNSIPFQPIILTKQWQDTKMETMPENVLYPIQSINYLPAIGNYEQHEQFETTTTTEYPQNCDSSKDSTTQHSPLGEPVPYQIIAKQEPDLDLEIETPLPVLEKYHPTSHFNTVPNDTQDTSQFQEPSVSTSCYQRSRMLMEEEIPDTPKREIAKFSGNSDKDLDIKDDDYFFVMSLLPSLRQIPRNRKFPLRLGIMNLIAKDLEQVVKEK